VRACTRHLVDGHQMLKCTSPTASPSNPQPKTTCSRQPTQKDSDDPGYEVPGTRQLASRYSPPSPHGTGGVFWCSVDLDGCRYVASMPTLVVLSSDTDLLPARGPCLSSAVRTLRLPAGMAQTRPRIRSNRPSVTAWTRLTGVCDPRLDRPRLKPLVTSGSAGPGWRMTWLADDMET
jgi:hypothetical protein